MYKYILFLFIISLNLFSQSDFNSDFLKLKAPEKFKVKFETTKGDIEITSERKLSPLAVDRFYQLVKSGYFTNVPVYRGVANFVVQFGSLDTNLDNAWSKYIIPDEPVLKSNDIGTIAFARAGKNSRGAQLFININNNSRLDTVYYGETKGFPVIGHVSSGMTVVYDFYIGYIDEPRQKYTPDAGDINEYLKKNYPNLDYIRKATIIEDK